MNYQNLDDIYAHLAREHAAFVSALADLSEAQANFRPAEGQWTIAEIAEHIAIANSGFVRIAYKLIKQAEAEAAPPLAGLNLGNVLLTEDGQQHPRKFPAPDVVKPKGGQSVSDSLAKIEQAHRDIQAARPRLEASDCSQATFPHPLGIALNPYQWMILYGEHMDRHRRQIEGIKTTTGYPS